MSNNNDERNDMKSMKWNKLSTRPITDEEKEVYGDSYDFMWEGETPEDGEEVLVYKPQYDGVYTDIWVEFNNGMGFENTDDEVIYWMSFPEPPKVKD